MMESKNTFLGGKLNQDLDERLLKNGEYPYALNLRVINSDGSDAGAVENVKGTEQISSFSLTNAVTIGCFADESNNKMYWFTTSNEKDMVVEYNEELGSAVVLLESSKPNSLLNFSREHLITGVVKIISGDPNKDLLVWTDNLNDIRCINIERSKTYGVDGFEEEDINLIKKPPIQAPQTSLLFSDSLGNNMQDRFIAFSYRYKYLDGEYSALSSFSNYAFLPNSFDLEPSTLNNEGMVNLFNSVNIAFDTGDKRVIEIDLVFKESLSSTVYRIEAFNKEDEGWGDNVEKSFLFSNNKNYAALPEDELFRTFDNVPRWAKALEIIENRLVFGNYVEGYDLTTKNGEKISPIFTITTESIGLNRDEVSYTRLSGNTQIKIDLSVVDLIKGSALFFNVISASTEITGSFFGNFTFILNKDFANASELAIDPEFVLFIETVWTETYTNNGTGTAPGGAIYDRTDPFTIVASTEDTITIEHAVDVYDISTPVWEFDDDTTVLYGKNGVGISAKTNRDYDVGIIYLDKYNRASTTLTSKNNTVYVKQAYSIYQNILVASIQSKPPSWATRYKFVVKQNKLDYETLYTFISFSEGLFTWFRIEGNTVNKIKEGDILIVKRDAEGIIEPVIEVEVLEIKYQDEDFITNNVDSSGNLIEEVSGTYFKVRAHNFTTPTSELETIRYSRKSSQHFLGNTLDGVTGAPFLYIDAKKRSTAYPNVFGGDPVDYSGSGLLQTRDESNNYVDKELTAGSIVSIYFKNFRNVLVGSNKKEVYENSFTVANTYSNFQEWWEAEIGTLIDDMGAFRVGFLRGAGNQLLMSVQGVKHKTNAFSQFLANVEVRIQITLSGGAIIFETKPKNTNIEPYYETSETLFIENGFHLGNQQDQSELQDTSVSRIDFYNCFVQGNGAESYKYKDAFNMNSLQNDLRPSEVSVDGYKKIHRYADLTYSEAYNPNTSINGLNEFNLSRANFKEDLDKKYGSIQKLYARDTDLVVFQENKVSKVLFGKDLLMNADGSSNVSAVESILGQQVSYAGEYGISNNPESFAYNGSSLYFTDDNRGTVLRLGLNGISEINQGLKTFYKDAFKDPYWTKKTGAFDPFFDQYVLSVDSETVLEDKELNLGDSLNLSNFTGSFVVTYNLPIQEGLVTIAYEANGQPIRYIFNYDGNITDTGFITTNGEHSFTKPEGVGTVTVTIDAQDCGTSLNLSSSIDYEDINVYLAVVNKESDIGKSMTIGYNWAKSGFDGGGREVSVMLTENAVPEYKEIFSGNITGLGKGIAEFPADSSIITMYAVQDYNADEVFTANNEMGIEEDATVLAASITMESGDFTSVINTEELIDGRMKHSTLVSNTDELGNLYLLWDLRSEYLNVRIIGSAQKNDCVDETDVGSIVPFTVPAGMFTSGISQADADAQAQAYFDENAQINANNNGTCIPSSGGSLVINSSTPTVEGIGTLDFTGGENNEILSLSFEFTSTSTGAINFGLGITVDSLDTLHTYREGTAQLNSIGNLSSSYVINSGCTCRVTIIGRSSAEPIPASDTTLIDNS